jgi:hypothetical protein
LPTARETHLAWAVGSWEAEVENARRLATRVNLVLTIALAFVGAGSKVIMDAVAAHRGERALPWLVAGAVLGIAFMFWAFVNVLGVRRRARRGPPFASAFLLPPEDVPAPLNGAQAPTEPENDSALFRAFLATTAAAYELHGRNAEERTRIDRGQQWLVVGVLLTMVCGGLYTWIRGAGAPALAAGPASAQPARRSSPEREEHGAQEREGRAERLTHHRDVGSPLAPVGQGHDSGSAQGEGPRDP